MIRLVALALSLLVVAPLAAQPSGEEEQVDIQELVRQIRRNMVDIEKEIDRVEAEASKEASEEARKNLQKLIESLKGRGSQITTDIDEIIKNLKASGGGGGSGQSSKSKQGQQPKGRNRNQRQNSGQQPDGQPQDGKKEDNTAKDQPGGRNKRGQRKPEPERVKIPVDWDKERWGSLPPELRQLLIDRNFKTIAPTYEQALREYYKRIGRGGR